MPVQITSGDAVFDALNTDGRRRTIRGRIKSEDSLLTDDRRQRLGANALDVWRNMGLLGWAVRRTQDYCCLWDFQPRTGDDGLNRQLRELMERDSQPERIDAYGRMDWDDMRRVAQAVQLFQGDAFFVQVAGGLLQLLEGGDCQNPQSRRMRRRRRWLNGAALVAGRPVAWNFRTEDPLTMRRTDRQVPARAVWQYVQHEMRPNVLRPQSALVASLKEFRDLDETFDDMRAKVKLQQLFGVAIKRAADAEDLGADDDTDGDTDGGASGVSEPITFEPGSNVIDLDEGEDITTVESSHPAADTQAFLKMCCQIALQCLDLPFNFLDASHTNFFGSRASWMLYERSCHGRRKVQRLLHERMARWRVLRWVLPAAAGGTGELVLPAAMSIEDVRWRWVPRGVAWWKPQEELRADLQAVAAGLKSMQDVCDERGFGDWRSNVQEILAERAELESSGLLMDWSKNMDVAIRAAGGPDGA